MEVVIQAGTTQLEGTQHLGKRTYHLVSLTQVVSGLVPKLLPPLFLLQLLKKMGVAWGEAKW